VEWLLEEKAFHTGTSTRALQDSPRVSSREIRRGGSARARRDWDKAIRRRASIEKARRILGYEPKTDMKTGLRKVYEWIRENRDRIEACVKF
jgi:nucleoside-diphosphate-sugar epimerase